MELIGELGNGWMGEWVNGRRRDVWMARMASEGLEYCKLCVSSKIDSGPIEYVLISTDA